MMNCHGNGIQNRHSETKPMLKLRTAVLAMSVVSILGCSSSDYSDLRGYINQVKARPAGRIAPVPEFQSYETFEYSASAMRDPFKMYDNAAEVVEDTSTNNGLQPNMERNKETLEQYPLDTLSFVGHLEKDGKKWAIVTSPDNLVHRVKEGNHLGSNYGEIVAISETKIMITEIIPDGMGGWIEREAVLSLSE
jgi:type IV pilus assembly protein PilP